MRKIHMFNFFSCFTHKNTILSTDFFFKVKIKEFPKMLEDFKESISKGAKAPTKDCQVTSIQPKSFPQIAPYFHSCSVPPNRSPLSDFWMWSRHLRSLVLGCWFTQGHIANPEKKKKKRFYFRHLVCRSYAMHSHSITFPPRITSNL